MKNNKTKLKKEWEKPTLKALPIKNTASGPLYLDNEQPYLQPEGAGPSPSEY